MKRKHATMARDLLEPFLAVALVVSARRRREVQTHGTYRLGIVQCKQPLDQMRRGMGRKVRRYITKDEWPHGALGSQLRRDDASIRRKRTSGDGVRQGLRIGSRQGQKQIASDIHQ